MTTTIKLTDTQRLVLEHAATNPDGSVNWFPDNVKGGARQKVVDGLFSRDLITSNGIYNCFITAEGYDALGIARPLRSADATQVLADEVGNQDPSDDEITESNPAAFAPYPFDEPMAPVAQPAEPAAHTAPAAASGVEPKPIRTRDNSKQATVLQMLRRPEGATIAQICGATGWQAHTVRGTFAGSFKKKLGLTLLSEKPVGAERTYRLLDQDVATC
jgi:hypothetical protein